MKEKNINIYLLVPRYFYSLTTTVFMKKISIRIVIILFLIISLSLIIIIKPKVIVFGSDSKISSGNNFDYSWTKAICDGNKCKDYKIKCLDEKVAEMIPITGEIVFSASWSDLRINKEKIC